VDKTRVLLAVALLAAATLTQIYSTFVDEAFDRQALNFDDEGRLVGLQTDEHWLVLKVSFPSKEFPENLPLALIDGETSALSYIEQMSGGRSSLSITMVDEIWHSRYSESQWGQDSSEERDVGGDHGGASELAAEAISNLLGSGSGQAPDIDLSQWDLNSDGVVDRLLILHSGEAQELGGPASSIWSHYSPFQDPVNIGDFSFAHYTMASVNGGLGVIIHEMLHQMGAVDLYDVHSETPSRKWNGLGDWDIMASGNWIGDGNLPSMPGASTLDLIGASSTIAIDSSAPNSYSLTPISEGGSQLRIDLGPGEHIWISLRSDSGFDAGLPGHGILVEQQDRNYGDLEDNLVNTDPSKAWAKVVEADGDDALLRGRDYGSLGDVFTEGDVFGNEGMKIRDSRGRMAPWAVTISNLTATRATVYFVPNSDPQTIVMTPRSPIALLATESAFADVTLEVNCTLSVDLSPDSSSTEETQIQLDAGRHEIPILTIDAVAADHGILMGAIGCEGMPETNFKLDWYLIGHRVSDSTIEQTVPWDKDSIVELMPHYDGDSPRTYSIAIDGAVNRIAAVDSQGTIYPGDPIILSVTPTGLLEPGMIARGELVLTDSNNLEQRIPLVIKAESEFPLGGTLAWLNSPSNALSLICLLLAASVATGKRGVHEDGSSRKHVQGSHHFGLAEE